ncbi:MAG: hypothetical protein QCI00_03415 [Candidatus Thermoplasmatota archaeon]|nr:hypothetical protein [Candidatus Thermoplasmatota archaeon]
MQLEDTYFTDHKKKAMEKFKEAVQEKKVDSSIHSLLQLINSMEHYFTTSSCAGRIVLLQLPELGDKKHAIFLGRWHRLITIDDVYTALTSYNEGQVWLFTQPPIFHIGCKHISAANDILNLGVSNGFKHSGIRSVSDQIIVELRSTERMDMPLGHQGELLISKKTMHFLVDIANKTFHRSQKKLSRLIKGIKKIDTTSF